jgi:hypothetical protein
VSHVNALSSVAVGAIAATAGVYAGPRVPDRTNLDWALAATAVAGAAAIGWGLWSGRLLATLVPFVLVTYAVGEWRMRAAKAKRRTPL